jgi:hypothetical protein
MANSKISALTSATTPLDGTEVLPIVQSSTTKKVSNNDLRPKQIQSNATSGVLQIAGPAAASTRVMTTPDANFTAARTDAAQSFTGDQTLSTGNLIQGTAAKGVNFTANTAAAGMTSRLLNWYEEGTWTPTIRFSGGSTGVTYSTQSGTYTRVGRQVTLNFDVRLSNKGSSTGVWEIGGFPFTAGAEGHGNLHYQSGNALITQLAAIRITSGSTYGGLYYASAGSTLNYAETDATNSSICIGQIIFFV